MLLQKEVVDYLSRQLIKGVVPTLVEVPDPTAAKDVINGIVIEELSVEDKLNDEVREILSQYAEYMRREGVSFADMFRKVKNQIVNERKIVRASGRDSSDGMKLSRDKITEISHKIVAAMRRSREFRLKRPENDIRLIIVKTFTDLLVAEGKIDKIARDKIRTQKREILEGSEEHEILLKRYYAEEMKKLGIDLARP